MPRAKKEFNPAITPDWVSPGSILKYHNAIKRLREDNNVRKMRGEQEQPLTEDAVKELYVTWKGHVVETTPEEFEEEIETETE